MEEKQGQAAVRGGAGRGAPQRAEGRTQTGSLGAGLLLLIIWLFWFAMYTYPPFFAPYLTGLNADLGMQGVIIGSYGFTQMLLRLPLGILSDRLQKRSVFIAIGLGVSAVSAFGLALTQNLVLILLLRGLAGVSAAMWVQLSLVYLARVSPDEQRHAAGHINALMQLGQLAAMLSGGWLADAFGYHSSFILGGAAASLGFALLFISLRRRPRRERRARDEASPTRRLSWAQVLSVARNPLLLWTSIIMLFVQLVQFATIQSFVPSLAGQLGATTAAMGLLSAFAALPRSFASLLSGRLMGRIGTRRLLVIAMLLTAICTALLPLMPNFTLLVINQLVSAIGAGLQLTILLGLCTLDIPAPYRSSGMGFFQSVYAIGMVIGPVLTGWLAGRSSLSVAFLVIAGFGAATALLTYLCLPEPHALRVAEQEAAS